MCACVKARLPAADYLDHLGHQKLCKNQMSPYKVFACTYVPGSANVFLTFPVQERCLHIHVVGLYSLVPGLLPCRKTGREPERSDHVPCDVLCVVLCVVLIIELMPTQSVLSVISGTRAVLGRCWSSGSVDVAETTDGNWKAISLLSS